MSIVVDEQPDMPDRTFKIGAVVRLKSGGPLMTVDELTTHGTSGQPTVSVYGKSNANMRFQSFFILITDQPFFFASS
jgi:Uncharacterized small protein (DUF2158)